MKAYFVSEDKNVDVLSWKNMICLSYNKDDCVRLRDEFAVKGFVLLIDMDDKDVVMAVASCLNGNAATVKCKVLEVFE